MINQLQQQKAELLNWYIFTKDKAIRKELRKLDKMIRKELDNDTKIHSTTRGFTKASPIG